MKPSTIIDSPLNLSGAEGNIRLPSYIVRALTKSLKNVAILPSRELYGELILKIAEYHDVTPLHVVLCNGSDEAIEDIAREFAGTSAFVITPCFERLYEANEKFGTQITTFNLTAADTFNFTSTAYKSIEHEITRLKPRTVWVCNPGNPTGAICDSTWLKKVALSYPGTMFVIDEAFMEIASEGRGLASATATIDNIIVIRSMSKAFGMAGLRMGYLITNEPLARQLSKEHIMFNTNTIAVTSALYALQGPSWQNEYARFRRNRDILYRFAQNNHILLMNTLPNVNFFCMKIEGVSSDELRDKFQSVGVRVKSLGRMRGLEQQGYCRILIPRSRRDTFQLMRAIKKIQKEA